MGSFLFLYVAWNLWFWKFCFTLIGSHKVVFSKILGRHRLEPVKVIVKTIALKIFKNRRRDFYAGFCSEKR